MAERSVLSAAAGRGRRARPRRQWPAGAVLAAVLLALVTACGGGGSNSVAKSDTFTFAAAFGIPTFDPIKVGNPFQNVFLYPVYDRLVHLAPDGKLIPGLAEEWEFNADATELTFKLRPGVTYSDGEEFTAQSVKANIERSRDTPASTLAGYLASIDSIETPDETTVVLKLSDADVSLPGAFADRPGMMISPKAIAGSALDTKPVGAGEYTLTSYVDNDRAVYAQRDDYWNSEKPGAKNLEMRIFVDIQARKNAIRTGEADAGQSDAQSVESFSAGDQFEVNTDPVLAYSRLTFGSDDFQDVRVRKAISLAVDREALNQVVFKGVSETVGQPWPASYFAAAPDVALERDVTEAKRLLAEAGKENLTFTAVLPALDPHPQYAEAIQSMLKEAGITMELVQVEPAQIVDIYYVQKKYDAQFAYFPGTPDPLITVAQTVLPTGFFNRGKIESKQVIDLYTEAKAEIDEAKREPLLKKLSAVLADQVVDVPLFTQVRPEVINKRVQGWEHYVSGIPEFRGVSVIK